jgi:hypothetical protein
MADISAILPAHVAVVFPKIIDGVDTPITVDAYVKTVDLLSILGLPSVLADVFSYEGTKTFHDSARANYVNGVLTNPFELNALTNRIALDFYAFRVSFPDIKFIGIVFWDMEGLSDSVEWTYNLEEISTRVQRGTWNDLTEELGHLSSAIPSTVSGPGLTVETYDLKTIISPVDTIALNQDDGYRINALLSVNGEAALEFASVDDTHKGAVDLANQIMGNGIKRFQKNILLTGDANSTPSSGSISWDSGKDGGYEQLSGGSIFCDLNLGNPGGAKIIEMTVDYIAGATAYFFIQATQNYIFFGFSATYNGGGAFTIVILNGVPFLRISDAGGIARDGITANGLTAVNTVGGVVVGGFAGAAGVNLIPYERSWMGL